MCGCTIPGSKKVAWEHDCPSDTLVAQALIWMWPLAMTREKLAVRGRGLRNGDEQVLQLLLAVAGTRAWFSGDGGSSCKAGVKEIYVPQPEKMFVGLGSSY